MVAAPLTPAECDLKDFQYMPLDVHRLLTSETWVLGTGDERAAAMSLWLESWRQVPAASLPNNERMLAHLSGSKNWKKVKEHALRGWIPCADGRLYHPTVAEKALEAWIDKLLNSLSGATGNAKRWGVEVNIEAAEQQIITAAALLKAIAPQSKRLQKKAVVKILSGSPPDKNNDRPPTWNSSPRESPPDSWGDRKREIREKKENISPQTPLAGLDHPDPGNDPARVDPPAAPGEPGELPGPSPTATGAMAGALRKAGVTVASHNPTLHGWVNDGFTVVQALEAVEICRQHKPAPEPIAAGYLDKVLRGQANGKPGQRTNGAPEPAPWEGAK